MPDENPEKRDVTYQIVPAGTQLGHPKLVDSLGFAYTLKGMGRKTGGRTWRCSRRDCSARVIELKGMFKSNASKHSHPSTPGLIASIKLKSQIKAIVTADLSTPVGVLVDQAICKLEGSAQQSKESLTRLANRARAGRSSC